MSNQPAIGNLNRTQAILKKYGIRAKKSYGQNFLTDVNVLKKIVAAAEISKNDNVIEIGPGLGALTEQLSLAANQVLALEIDQSLLPVLADVLSPYDNVTVVNQDILKADLPALINEHFADPSKPLKVVANLPYYITSPILMGLLSSPVHFDCICVMMQKEVAERLAAKPGTKQYGALTLAIQYHGQAQIAFGVSRHSFVPAPNVDSAIVTIEPRKEPLARLPFSQKTLFNVIKGCFAHRRKSLRNNLKSLLGKDAEIMGRADGVLQKLGLDPQVRPEKLTLLQFIDLTNALHEANLVK
ncbi:MAG TPA: 16S rRNA (adenine(1518)-N(6)/adenine(1519)-N(6))-dimethyltransferase RsmA [Candidatus Limosilactobacillus merdipullorum]|uniref:Ribosomal RNA small subunit methyltransferase A n=1 Tax=Candidatus Limosilactobacillus merdipullorum TaxID=2838653 RepID=A0A9D1U3M0_9LACO|nr:16S rRNA (adenine(1518)-N(6)/adenine(1519)-N(6))-dimethyltransferase RsmA [Candidatus Limosilactobacillus merdipullorum]